MIVLVDVKDLKRCKYVNLEPAKRAHSANITIN